LVTFVLAGIEEILKFLAAYFVGIHSRDSDEAVDVLVYVIAAALGFAALENTLYLITPILEGETTTAFLTGNMRFIGATLVHVSSSAVVGFSLAFAFFQKKTSRINHVLIGLFIATLLHTIFNLFIISTQALHMIGALILVWVGTLILFFLFEKIKHVHLNKI
jgi:RsiW-degrading membrane proteinase PrsW (M82 family)